MKLKNYLMEIIKEIDNGRSILSTDVINNTPTRIEALYNDIFSGLSVNPYIFLEKTYPIDNNNMIIEKNIKFYSMCEHHFLPFFGKIHLAYIPNKNIAGFGDIIKIIETLSKRPQLQERLCDEIATVIFNGLNALGVFVVMEAEHTCMTMRGVKSTEARIMTTSTKGIFSQNLSLKSDFFNLIKL